MSNPHVEVMSDMGIDRKGRPHHRELDKPISQVPILPPLFYGRGVVGHHIDRCITTLLHSKIIKISSTNYIRNVGDIHVHVQFVRV